MPTMIRQLRSLRERIIGYWSTPEVVNNDVTEVDLVEHVPNKSHFEVGNVVAIFTRRRGGKGLFDVGTILAVSKEKIRVQYWHCTKVDGTWSKTSLRRFGSSLGSNLGVNVKEHTGIIWIESGVIDKICGLQDKGRGKIDKDQLAYLTKHAQEHRKKSLHALKGDLRIFQDALKHGGREILKGCDIVQGDTRKAVSRVINGAKQFTSTSSVVVA